MKIKTFLGIRGAWFVIHDRLAQADEVKIPIILSSFLLMVK
jgi:hypothetical protein